MTDLTDNNLPPGASEQTMRAISKIAQDAGFEGQAIVDQLSDHISIFVMALRGLVGHEEVKELLTLAADSKGEIQLFPNDNPQTEFVSKEKAEAIRSKQLH